VEYREEKFKIKGDMKIKIFNSTDFSVSNSLGDNEMVAQLKEQFLTTVKRVKWFRF
jgi:hypothetical protein